MSRTWFGGGSGTPGGSSAADDVTFNPTGTNNISGGSTNVDLAIRDLDDNVTGLQDDLNDKLDATSFSGTMFGWAGDGSDGAVTLDGSTTYAGFASKSGNTYTLTRDVLASTLTINSGVTLKTDNFRIFAKTSVNNAGTLHNNGTSATLDVNTPGPTATITASAGNAGTNGATGATGTGNTATNISSNALGGAGGNGGSGSTGGSGTGGSATAPNAGNGAVKSLPQFIEGHSMTSSGVQRWAPGAGGGGGGGDGVNPGGAGGAGGGHVIIVCPAITNTGTISANGGAGGTMTTGNIGGGGGGGGGNVRIFTRTTVTGTITANGGSGASGRGTGTAGTAGSAGNVYQYVL